MSILGKVIIFPTLTPACGRQEGGREGGFEEGKREGNVVMSFLLNPTKGPTRM